MSFGDWSDAENNAIVAGFFAMLGNDLDGRLYNTAKLNLALPKAIRGSRGSIEFKHCNTSFAARGFARPIVTRSLPAEPLPGGSSAQEHTWLHSATCVDGGAGHLRCRPAESLLAKMSRRRAQPTHGEAGRRLASS